MQYFLAIDGLSGDSTSKSNPNWFELSNFKFNVDNPTGLKSTFSKVKVDLVSETGLTSFLQLAATGKASKGASIHAVNDLGQVIYDLDLRDIYLRNVDDGFSAGVSLEIDYTAIGLTTKEPKPDGTLAAAQIFELDLATGKSAGGTGNTLPLGNAVNIQPDTFFLAVGGLNGGSTDISHLGWFEISDFDFDILNTGSALGGGAGLGASVFKPIKIHVATDTGLTQFSDRLVKGQVTSGMRIDGVSTTAEASDTTFELSLGNVTITKVSESLTGGYDLELTYGKVGVTTTGIKANGSKDTRTFGYDVSAAKSLGAFSVTPALATKIDEVGEASAYFLAIDGFSGDSTSKTNANWFELSGFKFDITASAGGKAGFSKVHADLKSETGLTGFLQFLATGKAAKSASIQGVDINGNVVYDLDLVDVYIRDVDEGSETGLSIELDYTRMGLTTQSVAKDGAVSGSQVFGFDLSTGKSSTATGTTTPLGPAAKVGAQDYFLAIEGLNGGSFDKSHAGWFDISGFDFDALNTGSALGGAGGIGISNFNPITVHVEGETGLTALLERASKGLFSKTARIDGVRFGDGVTTTVYNLSLGNVLITNVSERETGGYDVTLDYDKIGVTTTPRNSSGAVETRTFGYDLSIGKDLGSFTVTPALGTNLGTTGEVVSYFLAFDGLAGDSTSKSNKNWFNVSKFDFALDRSGGTPVFSQMDVDLITETGIADFLPFAASGKAFKTASIQGVDLDGRIIYDLDLGSVFIRNVSDGTSRGLSLKLDYTSLALSTTLFKPDGSLPVTQTFGVGSSTSPLGTAGSVGADDYFLAIDGLNGGSKTKGHVGWFDISDFQLDIANIASTTSGGTISKTEFKTIKVHLETDAALTQLLDNAANGRTLKSARIDGVAISSAESITTYELSLGNVRIANVADAAGGGYDVTLDYDIIGLTTHGLTAKGTPTDTRSFGYDVALGKSLDSFSVNPQIGGVPSDIALSTESINEFSAPGTKVATIFVNDPDPAEAITIELLDDAGGRFTVSGDQLLVGAGYGLDFEQSQSHSITIRATDAAGNARTESFVIGVNDINPEVFTADGLGSNLIGSTLNDQISASGGNDTVDGGDGNDTIDGGDGNDIILGGIGNDILLGGNLNDNILGGTGNDTILGGAGSDGIDGDIGRDRMIGGAGNDFYKVDDAGDVIIELANTPSSNEGFDTVDTALASYVLPANVERVNYTGLSTFVGIGNAGSNRFTGGALDDRFVDVAGGNDTFSGGNGSDSMDFRSSAAGVTLDFVTNVHGGAAAGDVYASIEKYFGSNTANDSMTGGGTGRFIFTGGGGNDTLTGANNVDNLLGQAGADSISGLGGIDTIDGGVGNDTLRGGAANDYFVYSAAGFGQDIVVDFQDGIDRLKIHSSIGVNISAFGISGNGSTSVVLTQLSAPSNTITLNGLSAITITSADFVFY